MKFKRISVICMGIIMLLSMLTGCGKKSCKVEFNPSAGDQYAISMNMSMNVTQNAKKIAMTTDLTGAVKYTKVSDKNVELEASYNDFSMEMNTAGISVKVDENNELFKELIDKIKSMKIKMKTDKDGKLIDCSVEGADEAYLKQYGLDFSSENSYLNAGSGAILEDFEVKEGEKISIPLSKLLGEEVDGISAGKDSVVEGKVTSIKNDIAEIQINLNNFKSEEGDIEFKDFKATIKTNVKTGITESMVIDADMKGDVEGKVNLKTTMTKK